MHRLFNQGKEIWALKFLEFSLMHRICRDLINFTMHMHRTELLNKSTWFLTILSGLVQLRCHKCSHKVENNMGSRWCTQIFKFLSFEVWQFLKLASRLLIVFIYYTIYLACKLWDPSFSFTKNKMSIRMSNSIHIALWWDLLSILLSPEFHLLFSETNVLFLCRVQALLLIWWSLLQ